MSIPPRRVANNDSAETVLPMRLLIPFFSGYVQAGFPSPAENYSDPVCSLDDLCITNAEATFFVRVAGDSMTGDGIEPGDILIVDCSREPVHEKIVIARLNGEDTVKRILLPDGPVPKGKPRTTLVVLMPSNPTYPPIYVQPDEELEVVGVVTYVFRKL